MAAVACDKPGMTIYEGYYYGGGVVSSTKHPQLSASISSMVSFKGPEELTKAIAGENAIAEAVVRSTVLKSGFKLYGADLEQVEVKKPADHVEMIDYGVKKPVFEKVHVHVLEQGKPWHDSTMFKIQENRLYHGVDSDWEGWAVLKKDNNIYVFKR